MTSSKPSPDKLALPWPPRALSPNSRNHWAVVSGAKKRYRLACFMLANKWIGRFPRRGRSTWTSSLSLQTSGRTTLTTAWPRLKPVWMGLRTPGGSMTSDLHLRSTRLIGWRHGKNYTGGGTMNRQKIRSVNTTASRRPKLSRDILALLERQPHMTQAQIARELKAKPHSLKAVLWKLVQRQNKSLRPGAQPASREARKLSIFIA
jgi:hypothetical protein